MLWEQKAMDEISEGMIELKDGIVAEYNRAALSFFPDLSCGKKPPELLSHIKTDETSMGSVVNSDKYIFFQCVASGNVTLFLLRNENPVDLRTVYTDRTLYQMRDQMNNILTSLELLSKKISSAEKPYLADMQQNLVQMLRLISNIEFLNEQRPTLHFTTIDVVAFFSGVCAESHAYLKHTGITITFQSDVKSVLMDIDSALIERMLLGIISNSAKSIGTGEIFVRLRRVQNHVVLSVSDTGQIAKDTALGSLFQIGTEKQIPQADEKAGLGFSVIRRIVLQHGGNILIRRTGDGGLESTVSLPIDERQKHGSVKTDGVQTPHFSQILVELADVLPAKFYDEFE